MIQRFLLNISLFFLFSSLAFAGHKKCMTKPFYTIQMPRSRHFIQKITAQLDRVVFLLKQKISSSILIEVHTGSRGSSRYNLMRSQKQAEKVLNALIKRGISKSRLVAKGVGEDCPFYKGRSWRKRRLNRRIAFVFLKANLKKQTPPINSFVLPRLSFQSAQYSLTFSQQKKLEKLVYYLHKHPSIILKIEGHSDVKESLKIPKISLFRAQNVASYFKTKNIPLKQLKLIDRQYFYPVASNKTIEGRTQNRRVILSFIK